MKRFLLFHVSIVLVLFGHLIRGAAVKCSKFSRPLFWRLKTKKLSAMYTNSSLARSTSSSEGDVICSSGIDRYVTSCISSSQEATITTPSKSSAQNHTGLSGSVATCQESWNSYWSSLDAFLVGGVLGITTSWFPIYTQTFPDVETTSGTWTTYSVSTSFSLNPSQESLFEESSLTTPGIWHTSFPVATVFTDWTTLSPYGVSWESELQYSATTIFATAPAPSPTMPECSPPTDSAACSSLWVDYSISLGVDPFWWNVPPALTTSTSLPSPMPLTPACFNPQVNASFCADLREDFYAWPDMGGRMPGYNAAVSLAPGCTLGCLGCTLAAESFRILYWPTQSTNNTATTPMTVVIDDKTTLTSPQVYISFKNLGAYDSCSAIGTTIRSGIVPINSNNLEQVVDIDDWNDPEYDLNPTRLDAMIYWGPLPFSDLIGFQAKNITAFHLSIPAELMTLQPQWSGCYPYPVGM